MAKKNRASSRKSILDLRITVGPAGIHLEIRLRWVLALLGALASLGSFLYQILSLSP